ncbi:MAG: DUF3822 family protein [Bacteroidota bacterium]
MGRLTQNLLSPQLDTRKTFEYNLSFLIGIDRFFYFIHDAFDQCLALRAYHFDQQTHYVQLKPLIQECLVNDKLVNHAFAQVTVGFATESFTLVPSHLFRKKQMELYARSGFTKEIRDQLLKGYVPSIDAYTVYAFNQDIVDLLSAYFKGAKFHHISRPLIAHWDRSAGAVKEARLYVNIRGSRIEMGAFKKGKLLLFNVFTFKHTDDFLYYLLLVIKQLGWNPEKVLVLMSGEITTESTIFQRSLSLVRHLELMPSIDYIRSDRLFDGIPSHAFHDLIALKLCE